MAQICASNLNTISCVQLKLLPVLDKTDRVPKDRLEARCQWQWHLVCHLRFRHTNACWGGNLGVSRAPGSSSNNQTQGQEGKVIKEPENTVHQLLSPGGMQNTLTTATARVPICSPVETVMQTQRFDILYTFLLLTSARPPLSPLGSSRLLLMLQNSARGLSP